MSFGQLVAKYRQQSGLTQEELAERSGLSVRGIRDMEAGRVRSPRRESLRLLADAFGLVGADRERFQQLGRGRMPSIAVAGAGADDGSALDGDAAGGILMAAVVVGELTLVVTADQRRSGVQAQVDASMSGARVSTLVTQAPCGDGGVGKTWFAAAVFDRAVGSGPYEVGFWVAALSEDGRRLVDVGAYEPDEALQVPQSQAHRQEGKRGRPGRRHGSPPISVALPLALPQAGDVTGQIHVTRSGTWSGTA